MSLKDEQYKLSNIISNDIEVYGQHYKVTYLKQCSTGKIVYKYALRTARLLTVLGEGVCIQGGVYPIRGSASGGGVCPTRGVCIQVAICIRGVCPTGQIPLPMNRMTHRCKNINIIQNTLHIVIFIVSSSKFP